MHRNRKPFIVGALISTIVAFPAWSQGVAGPKERRFEFTYAGVVKELEPGQEASIWLPVPKTSNEQEVEVLSKKKSVSRDAVLGQEHEYGNKMLFFKSVANDKGEIPFSITYLLHRKEVKTGATVVSSKPRPAESIERFLQPDAMVPIEGKPLELIKDKKLPADKFSVARELYDIVNNHMKYRKEGKG